MESVSATDLLRSTGRHDIATADSDVRAVSMAAIIDSLAPILRYLEWPNSTRDLAKALQAYWPPELLRPSAIEWNFGITGHLISTPFVVTGTAIPTYEALVITPGNSVYHWTTWLQSTGLNDRPGQDQQDAYRATSTTFRPVDEFLPNLMRLRFARELLQNTKETVRALIVATRTRVNSDFAQAECSSALVVRFIG